MLLQVTQFVENRKKAPLQGGFIFHGFAAEIHLQKFLDMRPSRVFAEPRVLALMMPERDSSAGSESKARILCEHLGISYVLEHITAALDGTQCYRRRDEAISRMVPEYQPDWRHKDRGQCSRRRRVRAFQVGRGKAGWRNGYYENAFGHLFASGRSDVPQAAHS